MTPPIFTLAPQAIPDNFKWNSDKFHLTYPGHLKLTDIMAAVRNATSIVLIGYSLVHERARQEGETYTYDHTHFAMMFAQRLGLTGCRKFDVYPDDDDGTGLPSEAVHPNAQPKVTMTQMEQIFTSYHRGRKYNLETGKYEYYKPIHLEQHLPPLFEFRRAQLEDMKKAPDLVEACIALEPRGAPALRVGREDPARGSQVSAEEIQAHLQSGLLQAPPGHRLAHPLAPRRHRAGQD